MQKVADVSEQKFALAVNVGVLLSITPNGTCVYAVQVLNFNNGYNLQSMAYTQCYAAKRTV
jgi:hypothetical protein